MKAAVSRLPFGPKPKQMEVTDITTGHFVFTPVAGEPISFAALDKAIRDAGYEIEAASIRVSGTLDENRHVTTTNTSQTFHLEAGGELRENLEGLAIGESVSVAGAWKGDDRGEVIALEAIAARERRSEDDA